MYMNSLYNDDYEELLNMLNNISPVKKVLSDKGKESLKRVRYKKSEASYHSCPILCTEFEDDEEITVLPCNHCFNSTAIEKWLTEEKSECPVCRTELDYKNQDSPTPPLSPLEAYTRAIHGQELISHEHHVIPTPTISIDLDDTYNTIFESINRASNMRDLLYRNRNNLFETPLLNYRARVLSEDNEIQEAIIASLNDISLG